MIITISGMPGSGKSSVAKLLAKKLGYKRFSSGDFQRDLAKERGLTTKELGDLQARDPELDMITDKRMEEFGNKQDNFVMDAWLGAKFIPHSKKIFLSADQETRAKRIFDDKGNKQRMDSEKLQDFEQTMANMIKRDKVNVERWKRYYNFDYTNKEHYDLVIDTTNLTLKQVVERILKAVKK